MLHVRLTAEQRLQKAAIDIMANRKYRALSGVLLIGNRSVVEADHPRIKTAATNGKDEYYNRSFVDSLHDAELRSSCCTRCITSSIATDDVALDV